MKVLICVEERGGTLFNGRRTSSDRNVSRDMLREAGSLLPEGRLLSPEAVMAEGKRLWISPFSKKLFRGKGDYLVIVDDPLQEASEDEAHDKRFMSGQTITVFVEDLPLTPYEKSIHELVLYRWNRTYPFDRKLDIDLSQYRLTEKSELAGFSHDIITKERYIRKNKQTEGTSLKGGEVDD